MQNLLDDPKIPASVREKLEIQYAEVERMLDRIQNDEIHIAVFGEVSTGKSSVLNALIGAEVSETGPLHGVTTHNQLHAWTEHASGKLHILDTPGTHEMSGEERETMAIQAAKHADLVLFVTDGDLTSTEINTLSSLGSVHCPIVLILNKADLYSDEEIEALLESLNTKTAQWVKPVNIVTASANPMQKPRVKVDKNGQEVESWFQPEPDVIQLEKRIYEILKTEGKTLTALNASLFAGELSEQVNQELVSARQEAAKQLIKVYARLKAVAVGFNPIPLADLFAATALDVNMVYRLSQLYGIEMTKRHVTGLLLTITGQLAALMAAVWTVNLISSVFKTASVGLSIGLTAASQGLLAYYATVLVGRSAEAWLVRGGSWGELGAKPVIEKIVNSLDRSSILFEAREEIAAMLKSKSK